MRAPRWWLGSVLVLACGRGPTTTPAVSSPASITRDDPAAAVLELVEVAPGILAALQPAARRFVDCNAALIVTSDGVVVIDAPQRVAALWWLRAQADALTESPGRVLVSTHWHLDHTQGISLWRAALQGEGVPLEHWGHAGLAPLLATEGLGQLHERREWLPGVIERGTAMQASGQQPDGTPLDDAERAELDQELVELRAELDALAHAELPAPTRVVAEITTLELGGVALELIPLRAHTEADLVVYLPATGVLVSGDVLDEIPFGGHGHPRRWLVALQQLKALHPRIIIPGHGPVLGPEHLDRMIGLWEALLEQAALAIEQGETPEQRYAAWETTPEHAALRTALVTDATSERNFARFMPDSLARAMADLRGDLDGSAPCSDPGQACAP